MSKLDRNYYTYYTVQCKKKKIRTSRPSCIGDSRFEARYYLQLRLAAPGHDGRPRLGLTRAVVHAAPGGGQPRRSRLGCRRRPRRHGRRRLRRRLQLNELSWHQTDPIDPSLQQPRPTLALPGTWPSTCRSSQDGTGDSLIGGSSATV